MTETTTILWSRKDLWVIIAIWENNIRWIASSLTITLFMLISRQPNWRKSSETIGAIFEKFFLVWSAFEYIDTNYYFIFVNIIHVLVTNDFKDKWFIDSCLHSTFIIWIVLCIIAEQQFNE